MKLSLRNKLNQAGMLSLHVIVPLILAVAAIGGIGAYVLKSSHAMTPPTGSASTWKIVYNKNNIVVEACRFSSAGRYKTGFFISFLPNSSKTYYNNGLAILLAANKNAYAIARGVRTPGNSGYASLDNNIRSSGPYQVVEMNNAFSSGIVLGTGYSFSTTYGTLPVCSSTAVSKM